MTQKIIMNANIVITIRNVGVKNMQEFILKCDKCNGRGYRIRQVVVRLIKEKCFFCDGFGYFEIVSDGIIQQ